MKKQVTKDELLIALLGHFKSTNESRNVYNPDGTTLMTVDDASSFVEELKDSATPEQIEFESALDTLLHAFGDHFPECIHYPSPFFRLHDIWNEEVKADLRSKYNNL